ncbi:unnamed protein product [Lathyrus sativus]|nr:unnamed protein product [Lathyrus sativus]
MGNCGSNPKTNEGPVPVPLPVSATKEVKAERAVEETLIDEIKSLKTLLNENVEEGKKPEVKAEAKEVKAEPKKQNHKKEDSKVQEKPKTTEEAQIEAFFAKREG